MKGATTDRQGNVIIFTLDVPMTTQHFVHQLYSCSDDRNIMINITVANKLFIFYFYFIKIC